MVKVYNLANLIFILFVVFLLQTSCVKRKAEPSTRSLLNEIKATTVSTAAIHNAQRFMEIRREYGTFARYMWSCVNGKPIIHRFRTLKDYPSYTDEAVAWSKDLKRRGFKFLGPTVVYAHMQAVGMVNDHTIGCFRRADLLR